MTSWQVWNVGEVWESAESESADSEDRNFKQFWARNFNNQFVICVKVFQAWPVDSKLGAQTPRPSACGVLADYRLRMFYLSMLWYSWMWPPGAYLWRFWGWAVWKPSQDEENLGLSNQKKSNEMPLRCFYLIMEPCRGGDLLERADGGVGKMDERYGFIGCWTGCFQVFQLGLFNRSLDCSFCSWHIELSMEMTCQIRKLSHSSHSNLQLFLASAWSQHAINKWYRRKMRNAYIC